MEEENKSITSNPVLLSNIQESSDSDAASSLPPPAKRCRLEQQCSSFPSRFFQGIVLQHTAQWAAQIHANSHRLRPGTIEVDAVVTMTGDRSCNESKPIEYLRIAGGEACVGEVSVPGHERVVFRELFRKELTPSDVGKLNRLVIPKKQAERHFPRIVQGVGGGGGRRWGGGHGGDGSTEGMMLEFKDAEGRPWEFRYCYWRSSQSFVFTKGWNRFIRTKGLRQGDVVVFYRCEDKYGRRKPFCMIDVRHGAGGRHDSDEPVCALGSAGHGEEEGEVGLGDGLGGGKGFPEPRSMEQVRTREPGKEEEGESLLGRPEGVCKGRKSVMLFGVEIASS